MGDLYHATPPKEYTTMPVATPTKPKAKAKPASTGSLIDEMWLLREQKRALEAEVKVIEKSLAEKQEALMAKMGADGLDKATGKAASASITKVVTANVEDWDQLYPYIAKHKFWHLLQRRTSDPSFRELWEQGKSIPGVVPFTKENLNLRSLST